MKIQLLTENTRDKALLSRYFLLLILSTISFGCVGLRESKAYPEASTHQNPEITRFNIFLGKIRENLLSENYSGFTTLSSFPLTVLGRDDGSDSRVGESSSGLLYKIVFRQLSGDKVSLIHVDSTTGKTSVVDDRTNRKMTLETLENMQLLERSEIVSNQEGRIGCIVVSMKSGSWKIKAVYSENYH